MKKIKMESEGITLVALVITIIILIILAGIAIASLIGDNGLFEKAKEAKDKTTEAQEEENKRLQEYEDAIDYEVGTEITGINTTVTNPEGAMPEGAIVIQGNADEGIVIRDKNNNEWVWVEVPKTAEVYPTVGVNLDINNITDEQCNNIYSDLSEYANSYRKDGYEDIFYTGNGFNSETEYNTAKNNMIRSIYKNGGFWIGRYEVGDETGTEDYIIRKNDTGISNKAVIRANQIPYNCVISSEAQELCSRLSTGGKTGSLIFGIQWDLTCKFLENKSDLNYSDLAIDSTKWGNHKNNSIKLFRGRYWALKTQISEWTLFSVDKTNYVTSAVTNSDENYYQLLTTGASEDTKKMNIYDFAGNVSEWTLEYSNNASNPFVCRAGGCDDRGIDFPVSIRYEYNEYRSGFFGFRAILY